jgi:hypothetical protein
MILQALDMCYSPEVSYHYHIQLGACLSINISQYTSCENYGDTCPTLEVWCTVKSHKLHKVS